MVGGVLTCIPKDHSTKGWLQLAQWFLRRRFKCESLRRTTDGRRTPSDGKSSPGQRPGELKGCTRLVATSDKVYQLLANGRWFSPGTPSSSTTKTGRHDIAEISVENKGNNKITELRTILQRESQNS